MNRRIAAVVFAALLALALVGVFAVPRQAAALSLTLRVTPTTVSPGGTVTLSGRISPKLVKPRTLLIQRMRPGTAWTTIKRLSLAKGATSYRTRWVAGAKLGPVYFRAKLGTLTTGRLRVTVLAREAVQIFGTAFTPKTLTVKAWTRVTWTNFDTFEHTVTAVDSLDINAAPTGLFNGSLPLQGNVFRYTFSKPGTYYYECLIHYTEPAMHAEVVVQ
jgi:plastocyanin